MKITIIYEVQYEGYTCVEFDTNDENAEQYMKMLATGEASLISFLPVNQSTVGRKALRLYSEARKKFLATKRRRSVGAKKAAKTRATKALAKMSEYRDTLFEPTPEVTVPIDKYIASLPRK